MRLCAEKERLDQSLSTTEQELKHAQRQTTLLQVHTNTHTQRFEFLLLCTNTRCVLQTQLAELEASQSVNERDDTLKQVELLRASQREVERLRASQREAERTLANRERAHRQRVKGLEEQVIIHNTVNC